MNSAHTIYRLGLVLVFFAFIFSCKNDTNNTAPFILKIRIPAEATNFNPVMPMPGYSRFVAQDIFYTLATIDPKTLDLAPLLVKQLPEARKVSEGAHQGALAYDFELWEEAVWDDGKPMTGEDFAFSMKLVFHPYLPLGPWRGYFDQMQDVVVDSKNPKKFTVFLKEYYLLGLESLCQFPIYPAHRYDPENALKDVPLSALLNEAQAKTWAASDSSKQKAFATFFTADKTSVDTTFIMGAGPYRVVSVVPGEGTVLEKKTDWWGDKVAERNPYLRAFPQRIEYRYLKDEGAIETNLRNGKLDVVTSIAMDKFLDLQKDADLQKLYNFETVEFMGYNYWMLNNRLPLLSDVRVRQALAMAVDYESLKNNVYEGLYRFIPGPIHPRKSYFDKDLKPYTLNIEKSKALLAEAGWKDSDGDGILDKVVNGKKQAFVLRTMASPKSETSKRTAELIQTCCKKVGIQFEIDWKDISDIGNETRQGSFESALLASAQYAGNDDLYQVWHSESLSPAGDNRPGFVNAEADALIKAIRQEPDPTKRKKMYYSIQEVLHREVPVVFLGTPMERCITSKNFEAVITANRPNYVPCYFKKK